MVLSKAIKYLGQRIMEKFYPKLSMLRDDKIYSDDSTTGANTKLYGPYHISHSTIGDYTYIAYNAHISMTSIGKFCSIGPNLFCGYGIHPVNGLSTSPMFYSTLKQNGISLSSTDKILERESITIGNDVFIGANVTILDGVTIGDGAVIGAGAVVSKNIPPYAIAVGSPITVKSYRFSDTSIEKLLTIKWWDFAETDLVEVENIFGKWKNSSANIIINLVVWIKHTK